MNKVFLDLRMKANVVLLSLFISLSVSVDLKSEKAELMKIKNILSDFCRGETDIISEIKLLQGQLKDLQKEDSPENPKENLIRLENQKIALEATIKHNNEKQEQLDVNVEEIGESIKGNH